MSRYFFIYNLEKGKVEKEKRDIDNPHDWVTFSWGFSNRSSLF